MAWKTSWKDVQATRVGSFAQFGPGANKCEKFQGTDGRGEARRAELRGPKGREREWGFWGGAASPLPPARGSGGAL